ncbi:MAG: ABC transporter permease subunit [Verrucomicrobiae bacterium]
MTETRQHPRSLVADALVVCVLGAVLFAILNVAQEWKAPFRAETHIDLSVGKLPEYTLFSLARGCVAMLLSLVFSLGYATWAFYRVRARRILIPLLDILQSIPVLGFMPGLVLALVLIFPTTNLGLELACVLMIFTAQVWNMVFSYYDSLKAVPAEMRQMGILCGYGRIRTFLRIELPFGAQGLIYNGMVSMAGGWFFLTINEAFTLGNKSFQLPGVGSYMSVAIAQGNISAQVAAVVAMGVMIVAVDRLVWWPLVIWSRKFKMEDTASGPRESTLIGRMLARSHFVGSLTAAPSFVASGLKRLLPPSPVILAPKPLREAAAPSPSRVPYWLVLATIFALSGYGLFELGTMLAKVPGTEWLAIIGDAGITFLRVICALAISSLWTIPIGVWIGLNPKWARTLQPAIQFAASFPAPMLYPLVFSLVLAVGGTLQWGAIILMMLGAQWYILFNVAAGAQAIPSDMIACADIFRFHGWSRWRHFLLPAIFPPLVTGWITSAGGAWNASIVSEYLQQGDKAYVATGLGAAISEATAAGDFNRLAAAIVVMAVCVVVINRTFWKKLQRKGDLYCRFGG